MSAYLARRGFLIPVALLKKSAGDPAKYNKILEKLTITYEKKVGRGKTFTKYTQVYKYIKDDDIKSTYIQFPRSLTLGISKLMPVENLIKLQNPMPTEIKFSINLYENQKIIVDWLKANVYNADRLKLGTATCVQNFRAGQGKTFLAGGVINHCNCRTIFITARRQLSKQAHEDFKVMFPDAKICRFESSKYKKSADYAADCMSANIVICVIDSALLQPASFFNSFDLAIFDEVHMYCSDKRREIFWTVNTPYVLDLSATTDHRKDLGDRIYKLHHGNVVYAKDVYAAVGYKEEEVNFKCKVKVIKYKGPAKYTRFIKNEVLGTLDATKTIEMLLSDPFRRKVAVDCIVEEYRDKARCIMVFAEWRSALITLCAEVTKELKAKGLTNDINTLEIPDDSNNANVQILMGGAKDDDIENAYKSARIIFTTYGYGGTGTSIVRANTAVYYTSRRNGYDQIHARILRKGSDPNIERRYYDIWDFNTGLKSQIVDRFQAYDFYGAEREHITMNNEDAE